MKPHNSSNYIPIFTMLGILALSGCATDRKTETEKNFGVSVRHMISQQIYQPGDSSAGIEGEKSRKILDEYRKDVAKPKTVEKKIINIKLD